ncbi:hypothetical protein F751_0585 [Auxenochlorella protothecoides]|uniref:Uncharacterized protein n=1 Tax=Auxenochlorella protothecoides TaxID=3075 RepID=A0A087SIK4_AUXPR|nr:hypothetical protein F751_0585 [Auxenochlorella protothecoides]KFM25558.1 hypothetical protein F751_0585 [Auxenochlorella protothecoides]
MMMGYFHSSSAPFWDCRCGQTGGRGVVGRVVAASVREGGARIETGRRKNRDRELGENTRKWGDHLEWLRARAIRFCGLNHEHRRGSTGATMLGTQVGG